MLKNLFCTTLMFMCFSQVSLAETSPTTPQGHTPTEQEELWHLSEGADVFPLRWFLNVQSIFKNKYVATGSYLFQNLGKKFGVVEVSSIPYYDSSSAQWKSPMKWVGLTLAKSEPLSVLPDLDAEFRSITDFYIEDDKPKTDNQAEAALREIDQKGAVKLVDCSDSAKAKEVDNVDVKCSGLFKGQVEVPMIGTNCAFCHSNLMKFKKQDGEGRETKFHDAFVEGAPNLLNVRNFFRDLTVSTLKTMSNSDDLLANYFRRLHSKGLMPLIDKNEPPQFVNLKEKHGRKANKEWAAADADKKIELLAEAFAFNFKKDIGIWEENGSFEIGEALKLFNTAKDKALHGAQHVFKKAAQEYPKGIADNLARFFALSYGVSYESVDKTPVLKGRMSWFASLVGTPDTLAITPEGYGRTDAFGRISNAVARGTHPLPLIAPASFPPMWGMKYSNLFHYNGNTNSVIMRNIGQSFGLGALVMTEADGVQTVGGAPLVSSNIYNLNRIEQHLYNIKYPQWSNLAPKELKVPTEETVENITTLQEIEKGCNVYTKRCMECHDSGDKVGPTGELVDHKVHPLAALGTDPNHNMIQPSSVILNEGNAHPRNPKPSVVWPFRKALFTLTKQVKASFQDSSYLNIPEQKLAEWENRKFRGTEHFRDTFLGENLQSREAEYNIGFYERNFKPLNENWLTETFGVEAPTDYVSAHEKHELNYMLLADNQGNPIKGKYGYIAKTLAGIWATAPYLHNGSVPTIWHLVSPQEGREEDRRPNQFYVGCRVYDEEKLGYVWTKKQFEENGCEAGEFQLFDTKYKVTQKVKINRKRQPYGDYEHEFDDEGRYVGQYTNGNYNGGHDKGNQVVPDELERKALMTFLKVLQPTQEYAWEGVDRVYEISGKSCSVPALARLKE